MSKSKIIMTVDDYGVDDGINTAVINLAQWNVLNSVEVLTNFGDNGELSIQNTLRLLNETEELNPDLELGIHLTITSGKPISNDPGLAPILCKGHFLSAKGTNSNATRQAIYNELTAQINVLKSNPRIWSKVTHLTNHHDALWFFPEYTDPYIEVANDFGLPIRNPHVMPKWKEQAYYTFIGPRGASDEDLEKSKKAYRLRLEGRFKIRDLEYKSTNYLDSSHYSLFKTILGSNPYNAEQLRASRQDSLRKIFERVKEVHSTEGKPQLVEALFHLRRGGVNNAEQKLGFFQRRRLGKEAFDKFDLPYYNGITTKYFDGRYAEYMSLCDLHNSGELRQLYTDNNVEKGQWSDCGQIALKKADPEGEEIEVII